MNDPTPNPGAALNKAVDDTLVSAVIGDVDLLEQAVAVDMAATWNRLLPDQEISHHDLLAFMRTMPPVPNGAEMIEVPAEDLHGFDDAFGGKDNPTPPPRPVIRRHECGALADRDVPTVHCGAQARLYPCGWRCDEHRP